MHTSCAARGAGSAQSAADYLVGERDSAGRVRLCIEVVRGNPDHVATFADSLGFEHKYTSLVIAWGRRTGLPTPSSRPSSTSSRSRPGRDWSRTVTPGRPSCTGSTAMASTLMFWADVYYPRRNGCLTPPVATLPRIPPPPRLVHGIPNTAVASSVTAAPVDMEGLARGGITASPRGRKQNGAQSKRGG